MQEKKNILTYEGLRKYEDELIDFSRLRNAIVHQSAPDKVIAEPHLDVVEKIEKYFFNTAFENALMNIEK